MFAINSRNADRRCCRVCWSAGSSAARASRPALRAARSKRFSSHNSNNKVPRSRHLHLLLPLLSPPRPRCPQLHLPPRHFSQRNSSRMVALVILHLQLLVRSLQLFILVSFLCVGSKAPRTPKSFSRRTRKNDTPIGFEGPVDSPGDSPLDLRELSNEL